MKRLGLTDDNIRARLPQPDAARLGMLKWMAQVIQHLRGSRRSTTSNGTADTAAAHAVDARGAHASTPTSCSTRGGWTIT